MHGVDERVGGGAEQEDDDRHVVGPRGEEVGVNVTKESLQVDERGTRPTHGHCKEKEEERLDDVGPGTSERGSNARWGSLPRSPT